MALPPAVPTAVLELLMWGPPAESVEGPPAEHQPAAEGQLSRRVQEAVRGPRRAPRRLHVDPAQGARPAGLQGRPLHPYRPQPKPGSVSVLPPSFHSRARAAQCSGAVREVWHRGSWPSPSHRMGVLVKEGCLSWGAPRIEADAVYFCAEHPRKRLPRSLEELLDEAVKSDVGKGTFDETTDDDSAMVDKLRSDVAADRSGLTGIQHFHQLSDCPWHPMHVHGKRLSSL